MDLVVSIHNGQSVEPGLGRSVLNGGSAVAVVTTTSILLDYGSQSIAGDPR